MRTLLLACHAVATILFASCRVTKPSELRRFKDVKKAVLRDDGLYNVICLDGTVETGLTLEQLENDEVCNHSSEDTLRDQFVRDCRRTSANMLPATFTALKRIAGKTDCGQTYDELNKRDNLIIFAYPPATDDALTTIEPLKYFPNLKRLGVFAQRIHDLRPLSGLTNLESLALSYNEITDVSPLVSLINLENLDLSHNRIRDFSPVEKLPRLKKLTKDGNPNP